MACVSYKQSLVMTEKSCTYLVSRLFVISQEAVYYGNGNVQIYSILNQLILSYYTIIRLMYILQCQCFKLFI